MLFIKLVAAIVAVVAVAVIAAGLAMYLRLVPIPDPILALLAGTKPPEYSAKYYPPNTLAYAWLTLVPEQGQFGEFQNIRERLDEFLAFRDLVDLAEEEFEADTGIDLESQVMPWVGPEISIGLLDFRGDFDEPVIAAMIGVRDRSVAEEFLADWLEYLENREGANFDYGAHQGFDVAVDENRHQAYALTDRWLVFATGESALEVMLERIAGDLDNSLAENERFIAARGALPERRFASVYVDARQTLDLWEDWLDDTLGLGGPTISELRAPDWIIGSAGLVELGIVTEFAVPTGVDYPLQFAALTDPAHFLPDDTMGFMARTFDPDVDVGATPPAATTWGKYCPQMTSIASTTPSRRSPTIRTRSTCRPWSRTSAWTKYWTWRWVSLKG